MNIGTDNVPRVQREWEEALYYSLYTLSITDGMPLCLAGRVCEYVRGSMSGSCSNAWTLGAGAVGSVDYGYPLQCRKPLYDHSAPSPVFVSLVGMFLFSWDIACQVALADSDFSSR